MNRNDRDPPKRLPLLDAWEPVQGACPVCGKRGVLRKEPLKAGIWCLACNRRLAKKDFSNGK